MTQENCCQACNRTRYGIGKVIDLFEEDVARNVSGPALGKNGTSNMFGFTQVAVDIVHAHAASNVRRRLQNWAPRRCTTRTLRTRCLVASRPCTPTASARRTSGVAW